MNDSPRDIRPPDDRHGTVDSATMRAGMSRFATGVAVVTTRDGDGTPYGVTVNSFNSVSLDPPLVLWSLDLGAWSLPVFRRATGFAVNIMAEDQHAICALFASREEERFDRVDWHSDARGLPAIDGAIARFSCDVWTRYPGGDHEIMLGQVMACELGQGRPLVYCQGRLGAAAVG